MRWLMGLVFAFCLFVCCGCGDYHGDIATASGRLKDIKFIPASATTIQVNVTFEDDRTVFFQSRDYRLDPLQNLRLGRRYSFAWSKRTLYYRDVIEVPDERRMPQAD